MGLKKRLCNPPAEQIAGNGDHEVCGLFMGAGKASGVISDLDLRLEYETRVVAIEEDYMAGRRSLSEKTVAAMKAANEWLLLKSGM